MKDLNQVVEEILQMENAPLPEPKEGQKRGETILIGKARRRAISKKEKKTNEQIEMLEDFYE